MVKITIEHLVFSSSSNHGSTLKSLILNIIINIYFSEKEGVWNYPIFQLLNYRIMIIFICE